MGYRLLVLIAILGSFAWIFWPVMDGGQSFAFRDSAHYYYPLFKFTANEWSDGRVPLWNPNENCGAPLLADATASVFYPGKLIFVVGLDYSVAYNWYVIGHILLAALGAYLLAGRFGGGILSSGLCALTYAFSGSVLFQYCNVIFLVSAAWLPFAMLAAERMLNRRNVYGAMGFGFVMALMVLGGDPQTAYHAVLMAVLMALFFWRRDATTQDEENARRPTGFGSLFFTGRITLLAISAATCTVLAAVQIVPSFQWARHSDRAAFETPRSIYEIPVYLSRRDDGDANAQHMINQGLFGEPKQGTHHDHSYRFSVAPWRAAEMVWPNVMGRTLPANHRWESAIPGADILWSPSLYIGFVPLLLALANLRWFGGTAREKWLTWTAMLSALASMGWFGIGWVVHEYQASSTGGVVVAEQQATEIFELGEKQQKIIDDQDAFSNRNVNEIQQEIADEAQRLARMTSGETSDALSRAAQAASTATKELTDGNAEAVNVARDQAAAAFAEARVAAENRIRSIGEPMMGHGVGGIYWLMATLLPGYVYFRFPAKLFVVTTLCLSVLASRGMDRVFTNPNSWFSAALTLFALISLAGAVAFHFAGGQMWEEFIATAPDDPQIGPVDMTEAKNDLMFGLIHTALVCVVVRFLWALRGPRGRNLKLVAWLVFFVTAIEIGIAQKSLVTTAPTETWENESRLAQFISADQSARGDRSNGRVYRGSDGRWFPAIWSRAGSQRRPTNITQWERDSLYRKLNLLDETAMVESYGALASNDFYVFMQSAKYYGPARQDLIREPNKFVLNALSTEYFILPEEFSYDDTSTIVPSNRLEVPNVSLKFNSDALPRCWIVRDIEQLEPIDSTDLRLVRQRTTDVLMPNGKPRDFRHTAVLETKAMLQAVSRETANPREDVCEVISIESDQVEIHANLSDDGFVVLNDLYYPGWVAEVTTEGSEAVRIDQVYRANRIMRAVYLPAGNHTVTFRFQPQSFYVGAWVSAIGFALFSAMMLLHLTKEQRSWWA